MQEKERKEYFKSKLGERIASLRKRHELTQTELGVQCGGWDKQTISRLEKGRVNPEVYTLVEIADVFKISLSELLNFDYNTPKE